MWPLLAIRITSDMAVLFVPVSYWQRLDVLEALSTRLQFCFDTLLKHFTHLWPSVDLPKQSNSEKKCH
jgi:hypothetical protein